MSTYVTNTISYDKYETPIKQYEHCGWQSDSATSICNICQNTIKPTFIFKSNKHHCRFCGKIICSSCSQNRSNKHRICDLCFEKKLELKNSLIKLSSCLPHDFLFGIPKPTKIFANNFLFTSSALFGDMYCYDAFKNKWSVLQTNKQNKRAAMQENSVAFNPKTNEILGIHYKKLQLIKMNLINNNTEIIDLASVLSNMYVYKLDDASCMFINNQYHIIGGSKSNKHYILDAQTNILKAKWTFNDSILKDPGLIYLETKQTLYSFGGVTSINNNRYSGSYQNKSDGDYIYKCILSSSNDKLMWNKLKVKMPYEASNFGIVSCKHDKYILLFIEEERWCRPGIFIFDIEQEIFTKTLVQCPVLSIRNIQVFIPTDFEYKMNTLLSGYFHLNKTNSCEFLPKDIINLLMKFHGVDGNFVHLLSRNEHWKLNIDYILNNTEEIKDKANKYPFLLTSNLWS